MNMKILIDDVKLNLLLEQKKHFIGKTIVWDSALSSVSLLISVIIADYQDVFGISGIVFKTIFVILGLFFTGKSIFDIIKSSKYQYSYEELFRDINKLNEISHNHSIVVIKDSFNKFPNRFLVYEDKLWDCEFFLNYKENPNNEEFIRSHISNELKIDSEDIQLKYISQKIHEKYSEKAKEIKIYSHKFYLATIKNFPDFMKNDSFEKDGRKYHWRSMMELEQNPDVLAKNMDVVNFVKGLY